MTQKDKVKNVKDDIKDILNNYHCIICYGVAVSPIKCQECSKIYCSDCLPREALNKLSMEKKKFYCHMKCGSYKFCSLSNIE